VSGTGYVGVDLFFVLSGFLITGILADARGSKGFFLNFYMRRVLRIFPLYYAIVGLVTVVGPLVAPNDPKIAAVSAQQVWLWTYGVNVAAALRNEWTFYGMNHFWSLAVEEQFYLVWPLLVAALPRKRMAHLCLVVMVLAAGLRLWFLVSGHWLAAYALMPSRMDELAGGGFVALLVRGPFDKAKLVRAARYLAPPATLCALGLLFGGDYLKGSLPHANAFLPSVLSVLFGSLHVLVTQTGPGGLLRAVLERPFLGVLGRYSYGLYVLHHPLRHLFEKLFPPASLASHLHSAALGAVAFTVLAGGLSLVLAMLSFRFFESPVLALKRYFEYGRSRPAPVDAPVPVAPLEGS
jgi:peptidoglycan/LPS O-acetylase OafA/YrhL